MKRTLLKFTFQHIRNTALALLLLGAGGAEAQCSLSLSLGGTGTCLGADTLNLSGATGVSQIVWQNAGTTVNTSIAGNGSNGVTVAGDSLGTSGPSADRLLIPFSIALDAAGNVFVSDKGNNRVQKWAPGASSGVTVAGSLVGNSGIADSLLNSPAGIFVGAGDTLYIADQFNNRIQKWAPGAAFGVTVAGSASGTVGIDDSLLNTPVGVHVDSAGNIYVSDQSNQRVQLWMAGAATGTTVAGDPTGASGLGPDQLYQPGQLTVDANSNIYICDAGNNRVQRWAVGATRGYTVAGDSLGTNTIFGNRLYTPYDVDLDGSGNMYIADGTNNRVQRWQIGAARGYTVAGDSMTIAGVGANQLNFPTGVIYRSGALYVCDFNNNRVQKFGGSVNPSYIPTTAGSYVAIVTTSTGCIDSSNSVVVSGPVTPSVTVSAFATTICSGTVDTFRAIPANGGTTPAYQWYLNGTFVSSTNPYINGSLSNNDSVYVVLTSNAACASTTTATSAVSHITVSPSLIPSVSVSALTTLCAGAADTFTATPSNGGNSPSFQWYLNAAAVATGSIYTNNALNNNDSVYVVLTSSAGCATTPTATSSTTHITVSPAVSPGVSVTALATSLCAGSADTFTAVPADGGTSPAYQWYLNGTAVATGSVYTSSALNNSDSVYVVLTSNAACATSPTATSAAVHISVTAVVVPTATASAAHTVLCIGSIDSFSAVSTNGGLNPSYQWYINGSPVGTGDHYVTNSLANHDSVWVVVTSHATCASPAIVRSSSIHLTVDTVPHITLSPPSIFSGTGVTVLHAPSGFSSYQWLTGSAVIPNATADSLRTPTWGVYSVIVKTAGGCTDTSTTTQVYYESINELANYHVNVYPNPTDNTIYISAENLVGNHTIELADNIGRAVMSRAVEGASIHDSIDMSAMSAGIYMVMIRDASGILAIRKIVKN